MRLVLGTVQNVPSILNLPSFAVPAAIGNYEARADDTIKGELANVRTLSRREYKR